MGSKIGYHCDVWSVGCLLFELFRNVELFDAETMTELCALIEGTLGPYSEEQIKKLKKAKINLPKNKSELDYVKRNTKHVRPFFDFDREDDKNLYDVIINMLVVDADRRISLSAALELPFFPSSGK